MQCVQGALAEKRGLLQGKRAKLQRLLVEFASRSNLVVKNAENQRTATLTTAGKSSVSCVYRLCCANQAPLLELLSPLSAHLQLNSSSAGPTGTDQLSLPFELFSVAADASLHCDISPDRTQAVLSSSYVLFWGVESIQFCFPRVLDFLPRRSPKISFTSACFINAQWHFEAFHFSPQPQISKLK